MLFVLSFSLNSNSQIKIKVNSTVDIEQGEIDVDQQIIYKNDSNTELNEILLNDWISSYSNSHTPLVKKFLKQAQNVYSPYFNNFHRTYIGLTLWTG